MRRLLTCAVLIAGVIGLAAWALYAVGLSNIEGRPMPAAASSLNVAGESVWTSEETLRAASEKSKQAAIRSQA